MSGEDEATFVADLVAEQKVLDAQDAATGAEIVEAYDPMTLIEAKRFAAGWIGVAAQQSRNAEYCNQKRDELRRDVGEQLIELERLIRDVAPRDAATWAPRQLVKFEQEKLSVLERLVVIHATLKKCVDGG